MTVCLVGGWLVTCLLGCCLVCGWCLVGVGLVVGGLLFWLVVDWLFVWLVFGWLVTSFFGWLFGFSRRWLLTMTLDDDSRRYQDIVNSKMP